MGIAKPVGSRRIDERGYVRIKTAMGDRPWPFEHRVVWETANGPLPEGWRIHHDDGNPGNNALENLVACVSQSEHARLHMTDEKRERCRQLGASSKGRVYSEEHRSRISKTLTGRKQPNISAALKGRPKSPEHRAKMLKNLRQYRPAAP